MARNGFFSWPAPWGSTRTASPAPTWPPNSTSSGRICESFSLPPGLTVDNIVRLTSYLRDASYAEVNAKARLAALGGRKVPTTVIVAQTLESTWLVEIEIIAAV